jgi:hypothetical protein
MNGMPNSSVQEGVFSWSFPSSGTFEANVVEAARDPTWPTIHWITHPGLISCIDALDWKGF